MKATWAQLWSVDEKHSSRAMLFYGNNPDHIQYRIKEYVDCYYKAYKCHNLTMEDVVENPNCLSQISAAGDLFSPNEKNVVVVSQVTDKFLSILNNSWKAGLDVPILAWSCKLKKGSKLRLYFENEAGLKAVPSYEPDQEGFKSQLRYLANTKELDIKEGTLDLVGQHLSWNASLLVTYIEKIKWLAQGKALITAKTIWACEKKLDPEMEIFLHSFFNRDKKNFIASLGGWDKKNHMQNLYFFTFYLWKILELKELVNRGIQPAQAIYKLRPILPVHVNTLLLNGLKNWDEKTIKAIISKVLKAERNLKLNKKESFFLFAQELLFLL